MEIKATTVYDYQTYAALIRATLFKKLHPRKTMIICTLLAVLAVMVAVVGTLTLNLFMVMAAPPFIALSLAFRDFYYKIPKKQYKALGKLADTRADFTFDEEAFRIASASELQTSEAVVSYVALHHAIETSRYVYLYFNRVQAYIIDKNTLSGGSVEELRRRVSSGMKGKYILRRY